MEIHFLLDTNAYRQIGKDKRKNELQPTANELRKRGLKHNSRSVMSIVVSMELLKHFDESDPFFEECFYALVLQFFHTQTLDFDQPHNKIVFIPPLNTLLTKHFFDDEGSFFPQYRRIVQIVENATQDVNTNAFLQDQTDIDIIRKQLIVEKEEVFENLEQIISDINSGVLDWGIFKNNKAFRKQLSDDIKSGGTKESMAISYLKRAHSLLELRFPQTGLETKMGAFLLYFDPLLNLSQTIIEKLLNGATSLSNPGNEKWNTLNDIQILGAACYNAHQFKASVRTVIVTDDKAIHRACVDTYMHDNVWTVRQYLSFIY